MITSLPDDVATGIYARAHRAVANTVLRGGCVFTQGPGRVSYTAAPAIAEAVAAHLYYETQPTSSDGTRTAGWRVSCVVDADLWASTVDTADVVWRPCLDYGDPGATADIGPAARLVLSRTTQTVIAVDHAESMVSIVAPGPPGAFVESYKTVRHLLTSQVLAAGGRPLHASAVAVSGNVLAFCGHKGAGKSTALLHALLSRVPGLGFVANDRLLLHHPGDNGGLWGLCWPTVAGFGGSLLASIPGLNELIDPSVHLRGGGLAYLLLDLPLVEHVGDPDDPTTVPAKVRLTPRELTTVFGVPPHPGGPLTAVVEAALDLDRRHSTLTEVHDPHDKAALLTEHSENSLHTHPDWLGTTRSDQPPPGEGAGDLVGVRVFRLDGGRDFHDAVRGLCSALGNPGFTVEPPPRWHHGVYATTLTPSTGDQRLLTVRKNRGPYTGMFDLPGGSPDPGEDREATLARELAEETGATITHAGPWHTFDLAVTQASDGRPIQFRHHGHWRETQLNGITAPTKTDEDVDGLHWLPLDGWQNRNDLSAPLRAVLTELTNPEGQPR